MKVLMLTPDRPGCESPDLLLQADALGSCRARPEAGLRAAPVGCEGRCEPEGLRGQPTLVQGRPAGCGPRQGVGRKAKRSTAEWVRLMQGLGTAESWVRMGPGGQEPMSFGGFSTYVFPSTQWLNMVEWNMMEAINIRGRTSSFLMPVASCVGLEVLEELDVPSARPCRADRTRISSRPRQM